MRNQVELVIDFDDLAPIEIPVKYLGKQYILKEPTGDVVARWRNTVLKCTKLTDGKPSQIDGLADSEPLLVSMCLFERQDSPRGGTGWVDKQVPVNVVRSWQGQVVKRLFDECKRIGQLDEIDTIESLEKEIKAKQEKLAELREKEQAGHHTPPSEESLPNGQLATTDGSV